MLKPMGLGRPGTRVENRPRFVFWMKGAIIIGEGSALWQ